MTGLRARLALAPLRVRLVAAVLVLVALGLLVTGVAATTVLRGYLLDQVDGSLREASRSVAADLRLPYPADAGRGRRGALGRLNRFYVLVLQPDDQVVHEEGVGTGVPPPALPAPSRLRTRTAPFTTGSVTGDARWRVLVNVQPDGGSVTFAAPLAGVDATVSRLLAVQTVVSLAVLGLLAGAAYAMVRRSLRPLRDVEQTAALIAAGDLSRRVPRQDDRTEVGRLALAFNSMLARIEGAFRAQESSERTARASEARARESEARLRRFVADASHELRTPLTSIRGFAELYRQGAVPAGPDLDRVMVRVEGEATRMGQLVEEMLLLARLDQQRPLDSGPVDLLHLAADAVHDAQGADPDRSVLLELTEGTPAPVVLGDEARLRQVLVNLLGNALTHTPPGSPVVVRLSAPGRCALLEVVDHGPGLRPDEAAKVFERFYRADTARTRATGGSGLGLSIVRAVVEASGGRVGVRSTPGQGATFLVELPLAA